MRITRRWTVLVIAGLVIGALAGVGRMSAQAPDDPVVRRIIELGTKDNQVMTWNDYASNRFGGRETGSNAYTDATQWAVWQFKQWGLEAELDEVGEVPVGFNRGPWFGKMLKPTEKALHFGTPSFTAGTKGVQKGGVFVLKADPFSIPGRAQGGRPLPKETVEKKRTAVEAAIAEVKANRASIKGKWVLIAGASTGFARDGRRASKLPDGSPEYLDAAMMPPLTQALIDAGALGTIQSSTPTMPGPTGSMAGQRNPPLQMLDGYAASWDSLPVLPDIKLVDTQYNEIKGLVEKNQPVELEFDIRNWFKMGPIKYHNVVATLRGTTSPDEYVVLGGHYDCFSAATGGVDDGSGFAPGMEALRLIKAAGARPKRSIVVVLFAAEEIGLVGSQSWLKKRPELHGKVVAMFNRDGSPSVVTGVAVPETWHADFQAITAPLTNLNPKWPFRLEKTMPRAHATSPGGTDSSSFEMVGIPTVGVRSQSDYAYRYAWHTTNDLYSELVPYTEHQQHSSLAIAVMAYGIANLDKPLTRDGVYLPDGLYATIAVGSADKPVTEAKQLMVSLDFANAPVQTANLVRIIEGRNPPVAGGRGAGPGPGPAGPGGPPGGRGAAAGAPAPPIGSIVDVKGGLVSGLIVSATQKSVAMARPLPKVKNPAVTHDTAGVFGVSSNNGLYLTLKANRGLDNRYTALGKVIAGLDVVPQIKKGDTIRSIRFTRVGRAASDFKTDDEAFKTLLAAVSKRK